jgi:hypothetical protein
MYRAIRLAATRKASSTFEPCGVTADGYWSKIAATSPVRPHDRCPNARPSELGFVPLARHAVLVAQLGGQCGAHRFGCSDLSQSR